MERRSNNSDPEVHYGRLAKVYLWLEYAAFGRSLQHAREAHLDRLKSCLSVAVFGAGDGRCFGPLLLAAPHATFESIENSEPFIRETRKRVEKLNGSARVNFHLVDARSWTPPRSAFDAVVTHFFLDCFTQEDLRVVVNKISDSLKPGGQWIFADFNIPTEPGFSRWRARAIVSALCTFFRWQAGHPLKSLPPMEEVISEEGFDRIAHHDTNYGLIRTAVYCRRSPRL